MARTAAGIAAGVETMAAAARGIRLAGPGDAPQVADIYRPVVEATPISFELEPPCEAEVVARMAAVAEVAPWLVCHEGDRVLGYAYASRHHERAAYRWSVDVSVYVRDGHRGGGIGRALYQALLPMLRAQGYCAAHAGIALPNPASVALHEAVGFQPVGVYRKVGWKLGAWHDVGWWQLALRERTGEPPTLLTVAALQATPAWAAALEAGARWLVRATP